MTTNITEIVERANKGDVVAQHEIDRITGAPEGTYAQLVDSFDSTKVAAEMGNVECMEILGQSYYTGMGGVGRNIAQAQFWLEKASAASATATWYLAQLHSSQHEDYATSTALMHKAVSMGVSASISQAEIDIAFKTNELLAKIKETYEI